MIKLRIAMYNSAGNVWVTKYIWEIMDPSINWSALSLAQQVARAISLKMLPTEYKVTADTYCKDIDRTSDYELENITNINYKVKPEFTWRMIRAEYLANLLTFVNLKDDYKVENIVTPEAAPIIRVTFNDLMRERTIEAYLGQSIEVSFVEYDNVLYAEEVRLAFPER